MNTDQLQQIPYQLFQNQHSHVIFKHYLEMLDEDRLAKAFEKADCDLAATACYRHYCGIS